MQISPKSNILDGVELRIMGIDPGLVSTGYAAITAGRGGIALLEAGVINSPSGARIEERLLALYDGILQAIRECRPSFVVVEDLYSSYRNPRTAVLMGHARGVILLAAGTAGISVQSYPPARVKKSLTGNGRATKAQVQRMIQVRLGLASPPEPDHVADALAVALCHASTLNLAWEEGRGPR